MHKEKFRLFWYLNRLKKMTIFEIFNRIREYLIDCLTRIKYRDPSQCVYTRFAKPDTRIIFYPMPGVSLGSDWTKYRIYNYEFDLTKEINWKFTGIDGKKWPSCHYSKINYRPGNPYGDIRINWELNRLQFLPALATENEELAHGIISDWFQKNPYLHGPSYISSMEIALRWISIYWAINLFKKHLDDSFMKKIVGFAIASGKYINSHLSLYSSAGNHLIVEAVGLFWIGKAIQKEKIGQKWLYKAREILWKEILRQINSDGSSKEQSFWYLGFILDAFFHYLLLEKKEVIPYEVLSRIEKSLEFVDDMMFTNTAFPDYGDRDDGFVFRVDNLYEEPPFYRLLNDGAFFFNRPEWYRGSSFADQRLLTFWSSDKPKNISKFQKVKKRSNFHGKPALKTYTYGGMTLIRRDESTILFRHSPLGLEPTFGHGHADALSVLIYWRNTPVLIDLGAGQYNGDQNIRNYFRSTIAHNTVEIEKTNQADILGSFLWDKSYETFLVKAQETPTPLVQAYHTGYKKKYGIIHNRKIEWPSDDKIVITDKYSGVTNMRGRGAFHLGPCNKVIQQKKSVESFFNNFRVMFSFPKSFNVDVFYGSLQPFIGWRSTVYGNWDAIYSIIFSFDVNVNEEYEIRLKILED